MLRIVCFNPSSYERLFKAVRLFHGDKPVPFLCKLLRDILQRLCKKFLMHIFGTVYMFFFFMSTILYRCLYSCNEQNKLVMHAIVLFKQKFSSALSFMPMVHGSEY